MQPPGMWAFIGADPGVTAGLAWGTYTRFIDGRLSKKDLNVWDAHACSCDADGMVDILHWRIESFQAAGLPILVQVEKFVRSNRRAGRQSDYDITQAGVNSVKQVCKAYGVTVVERPAADVKLWGTDKRLEAIGFPMAPKLKDAKDAGRHMLFGAVKSGRAEDPLL